jgi:hypothetical protein
MDGDRRLHSRPTFLMNKREDVKHNLEVRQYVDYTRLYRSGPTCVSVCVCVRDGERERERERERESIV